MNVLNRNSVSWMAEVPFAFRRRTNCEYRRSYKSVHIGASDAIATICARLQCIPILCIFPKYFCTPYLHYSSTLPKALFSRTASLLSRLIATCHNRVACIAIHQSQAGSHPHFSIAANDRLQRHHPSTHQQSDAPKSMVCARRIGMAAHGPVGTLVGRNMVETCKPMPSKCLIIDVGKVRS